MNFTWGYLDLNQGPLPYQGSAANRLSYSPMAEEVGLEPTRGCPLTVFGTAAARPTRLTPPERWIQDSNL